MKTLRQVEDAYILEVLEKCGHNRTRTAKALRIGLRTLQRRLAEYARTAAPEQQINSGCMKPRRHVEIEAEKSTPLIVRPRSKGRPGRPGRPVQSTCGREWPSVAATVRDLGGSSHEVIRSIALGETYRGHKLDFKA